MKIEPLANTERCSAFGVFLCSQFCSHFVVPTGKHLPSLKYACRLRNAKLTATLLLLLGFGKCNVTVVKQSRRHVSVATTGYDNMGTTGMLYDLLYIT